MTGKLTTTGNQTQMQDIEPMGTQLQDLVLISKEVPAEDGELPQQPLQQHPPALDQARHAPLEQVIQVIQSKNQSTDCDEKITLLLVSF
jgi:hypothetical protein